MSRSPPHTPAPSKRKRQNSPHSTPLRFHRPSLHIATSNHYDIDERFVRAAEEMKGNYEELTLEAFLSLLPEPPTGKPMPTPSDVEYKELRRIAALQREIDMYTPFADAMQPYLKNGWKLVNSSNCPDSSPATKFFGGAGIQPDMSLYENPPDNVKTDASIAEAFGEFKVVDVDDPFYRRKPKSKARRSKTRSKAKKSNAKESNVKQTETANREPNAEKKDNEPVTARDTRGQITLYMNAIQATQHRSRVFFFFILRNKCRLFCHSRAGTQYTGEFYHTEVPFLHEFFWRLTHGAPAARGHDTTMVRVTDSEADVIVTARQRLNISKNTPLYSVTVETKTLYVHQPFTHMHRYPVGRATRCFVAYDPSRDKASLKNGNHGIVLLKDCWRNSKYEREDLSYAELEANDVKNIPSALAASDVGPKGSFSYAQIGEHLLIHYRLVLDIVGQAITESPSTLVFSAAMRDAFKAHREACEKAGILHRDISIGNIVLYEGKGYLIDWERAKKLSDTKARAKERTGTWEFMSIRLLRAPNLSQEIRDDLESFVYVMLHAAICFAENAITPAKRRVLLEDFAQTPLGSTKREELFSTPSQFLLETRPFNSLIKEVATAVSYVYLHDLVLEDRTHPPVGKSLQQEIEERKCWLWSHDWMEQCFEQYLADPTWPTVGCDWKENEIADLADVVPEDVPDKSKKKKKEHREYHSLVSREYRSHNIPSEGSSLQESVPRAVVDGSADDSDESEDEGTDEDEMDDEPEDC